MLSSTAKVDDDLFRFYNTFKAYSQKEGDNFKLELISEMHTAVQVRVYAKG